MLNFLKKSTALVVATLLVATSVFANDDGAGKGCETKCAPKPACKPCPQPNPPKQMCPTDPCCPPWASPVLNAAYNYPARTQTRCPWDIYFDASFIYWQPTQDNMELAVSNETAPVSDVFVGGINGSVVDMDFDFQPGFKVGMGGYFDHDDWDVHAEYTWFHCSQDGDGASDTASESDPIAGVLFPLWGFPDEMDGQVFHTVSGDWDLKMDIADLDLGRWYYVGTKLTFRPNFGARAAWIRQNMDVVYDRINIIDGSDPDVATITSKSTSWGVGAKAGLDSNWIIGSGFRLFGCGEADILFTRYTSLSSHETHSDTATFEATQVKQKGLNTAKTHLDLELGLGWGTDFDCHNWYFDVALGYGFQVFFDQNMFRHFNDDVMEFNSTSPNGNLYVQGLTATFKLDF